MPCHAVQGEPTRVTQAVGPLKHGPPSGVAAESAESFCSPPRGSTQGRGFERALKVGHLPTFTRNPYVLAMMTQRYNQSLRTLAERRGLVVIDLERWSGAPLRPRDAYFFDSVHLYEKGQEMIGDFLASELLRLRLREVLTSATSATTVRDRQSGVNRTAGALAA